MFSFQALKQLRIYRRCTNADLLLKFQMYKLIKKPIFARNMESLYINFSKIFGQKITSSLIRNTVGKQFIAGENNQEMIKKVQYLNQIENLTSIISLSVENQDDVILTREEMNVIRDQYIESCFYLEKQEKRNMIAVKLSPLCDYKTQLKLNKNQIFLYNLLKEDTKIEDFKIKLKNNNIEFTEEQLQNFLKNILKNDSNEVVYYVNWRNYMHSYYVIEEQNNDPIYKQLSPLTQEDIQKTREYFDRILAIMEQIKKSNIQVIFDAEQSVIQSFILSLTNQIQSIYNVEKPILIQTVQNYLKSSKELIEFEVLKAKKFKTAMGLKLVRGAYIPFETQHSKENNLEYPICDSFEHTTQMITDNIKYLLHNVQTKDKIIIASHNEETIIGTISFIKELNLQQQVNFAQLYGLGDNLTCMIQSQGFQVYKLIPYGEIGQVFPYLLRRAQESSLMFNSVDVMIDALRDEIKQRIRK